jgi:hypothetical protein
MESLISYQKEFFSESGTCPYQASGKFYRQGDTEYFFYFRARGVEIEIEVYSDNESLEELLSSKCLWSDNIQWGKEFEAGYITQQQASYLLDFFIVEFYINQKK